MFKINAVNTTLLEGNFNLTFAGGGWGINNTLNIVNRKSNFMSKNISVSRGDMIGIRFKVGNGSGQISVMRQISLILTLEKN